MEVPEFDLFKRIENLEQRTKGELTIRDVSILSLLGLEIAFAAMSLHAPQFVRKYKDDFLRKLKEMGFNKQWLDILEEDFLDICEGVEKIGEMK